MSEQLMRERPNEALDKFYSFPHSAVNQMEYQGSKDEIAS
jgi:hypothetical protein